jgi:hypothetical protein
VKKELTEDDFRKVKMGINIGNLEEHSGSVLEAGLFPADTDPLKMQTCYWLRYQVMGEQEERKESIVSFDSSTNDNGQLRINLNCTIRKEFSVSS